MNIRIPDNLDTSGQPVADRAGQQPAGTGLSLGVMIGLGTVAAVLLALVLWAIFAGAPQHQIPPAPVIVAPVRQLDMPVVEHTIGTVVSNATVNVTARVTGQLLKAYFTEGQTVKKGDVLFQIDPRPYQATLNNAVAVLRAAKAKAARYGQLLSQKAIAAQDADDAESAYQQAEANVVSAQLNLEYTQIRSPIDGKTGPILIQPGNIITAAGGSNSSGTTSSGSGSSGGNPLVVITQVTPIKISFALPQADLPRIQARMAGHGMPVILTPQGESDGRTLNADVDFVGNQVNDQAGTIELRATFANTDGTLVPGQLVDVGVQLALLKRVLVVPHDAVNPGLDGNYVYAVRDGVAKMVPVKVLHDDGTSAAVTGGLTTGDRVVTDGQMRVVPDHAVAVSKPSRAAP